MPFHNEVQHNLQFTLKYCSYHNPSEHVVFRKSQTMCDWNQNTAVWNLAFCNDVVGHAQENLNMDHVQLQSFP